MAKKKLSSIGSKKSSSRKRKPKLRSQGFIFPRKVAISLAFALCVAMGYIYLHNTNKRLGVQIKKLEGEREVARSKALNQVYRWEDLTTPEKLELAIARHGLNMRIPEGNQVVLVDSIDYWLERGAYADDSINLVSNRKDNR